MSDEPRNAVFARVGSRTVPRITRMMQAASDMGFQPVFCGAFRGEDLPGTDTWEGWRIVRLGKPYPLLNGRRPWLYLKSVFYYNRDLLRHLRESKAQLVHASDFESMPASITYRLLSKTHLVYNIHDNLAQRYNLPGPLRFMLNQLEGICVLFSHAALVPEEFRRQALPRWCRRKVSVIRNTPTDLEFAEPSIESSTAIRIFFGGWLDWGRGLRSLVSLAANNADIELRIAGEGSPDIVRELSEHPNVRYLGFLEHRDLIEEMKQSHFVPALYDPQREINRFAASNKLAEALAIGRPVILNSELRIVRSLGSGAHLLAEPYSEINAIGPRLRRLYQDRAAYVAACEAARDAYTEHYDFAQEHDQLIGVLGGQLH